MNVTGATSGKTWTITRDSLVEVEDGERWRFSVDHPGDPVGPYLKAQGRFRRLTAPQIQEVQAAVDARWAALVRRVESGAPYRPANTPT